MKQILAVILTIAMIVTVLSGCNISQKGNGTENSQTSQTTEIPQSSAPLQSSDSPQSEGTKETSPAVIDPPVNGEQLFKYDKYKVTSDARDYMTDREYELYCKMIDSILAHDGVVSGFESYEEFEKMLGLLFSEFIPVRYVIQSYLQSNEPFSYENGTATFKFVGDEETCSENYAAFENKINEALALIKEDDSDWERIAKLYLYVSNDMT